MTPEMELWVLTSVAGIAIPIGGWIASIESIRPRWLERDFRHTVIAFGGGALVSAVALVLVPEGTESIETWESVTAFAAGGVCFCGLQTWLDRSSSDANQLVAMLSDYVPEVIALGATVAVGGGGATLLAAIIALQNLPEGFNAYRELVGGGMAKRVVLGAFLAAAAIGPPLGAVGFWLLADQTRVLGWMQVFAAAGILYLVFQDVAPQAKEKNHRFPALGAVVGFLLGLVGKLMQG